MARNLFQSLAAGIMLVEPQQSSDNSLCSHPVASKTSQSGITCHKLQKAVVEWQLMGENCPTLRIDGLDELII